MAITNVEHANRAEQQRARRLAKRTCGQCGEPAAAMAPWAGQQIPICGTCQAKLDGPTTPEPWCAFNELHTIELRPQVPSAGLLVEARLLPAVEPRTPHRSLGKQILGILGRVLRRGAARQQADRALVPPTNTAEHQKHERKLPPTRSGCKVIATLRPTTHQESPNK